MPQRFIEAEYFRTDLPAIAAGNAFFRDNYGDAPRHFGTSIFTGPSDDPTGGLWAAFSDIL
jgi:hypothetical protein